MAFILGPSSTIVAMEGTGKFIGGRWTARVELLPGEFEVFMRAAGLGWRPGQLVFTNQRFIWRPGWTSKAGATDVLSVAHERVASCDLVRPWQRLFLQRVLRLRLHSGEMILLGVRNADAILPLVRDYMSRGRYRPGELFT